MRIASALLVALLAVSCASTRAVFRDAPAQPAATAETKVGLDDNGNAWAEVWVEHLAPPNKLTPPKQSYLLWAESTFGRTHLLGQLRVDKNLEASWEGAIPFDRFRLIVTAEDTTVPEFPSSPFVMTTDYLAPKERWF